MSDYSPFFSIIIPVYNIEKYISYCVNSVLAQSFDDYEIVLVDDGSSDNCFQICDEFAKKDKRIHVIHQENKGLSEARNAGIEKSKGEYIIFLDGDDWIGEQDTFFFLKNVIDKSLCSQVFICLYDKCKDGSTEIKTCGYSFPKAENKTPLQIFRQLLTIHSIFLGAQVFIISNKHLKEKKLFFEKDLYHEDNLWIAQIFMRSDYVQLINIPIFCYRQERDGSIMSSITLKNLKDQMRIIHILENEIMVKDTDDKTVIYYWLTKIYKAVIMKAVKSKIALDNKIMKELKKYCNLLHYGTFKDKIMKWLLPIWFIYKERADKIV